MRKKRADFSVSIQTIPNRSIRRSLFINQAKYEQALIEAEIVSDIKPEEQTKPVEIETETGTKTTQTEEHINKEENKMEMNNGMRIVSVPAQTTAQNNEPEAPVSPMDELTNCIEAFKLKIKTIADEAAQLARKVKEVQIAQKQKEREFVQARRAIERIKMAI